MAGRLKASALPKISEREKCEEIERQVQLYSRRVSDARRRFENECRDAYRIYNRAIKRLDLFGGE